MTKKPVSNVGASVRQRLLNLRDQTGEDAHALFTQFAIERFLYRLSRSSLADRFVLKGAMLFRVWSGSLHRPTKDVDLLGFGEPTPASVAAMIRQIINTAVEGDGITFDAASIRAEEIRENDDYGGIRTTFTATLDKAIIPLQADVGFGDSTDTTEWIVGHDRTNLKTYVRTYGGLKIQVVDFSRVGFEKPGLRTIEKKPASRISSADADREDGSYCLELVPPNPLRVVRRRCSRGDSPRR